MTEHHWHKSTYSSGDGGNCVEVAAEPAAVLVRDTKDHEQGIVSVHPQAWAAFLAEVTA